MTDNIKKTKAFLFKKFDESAYYAHYMERKEQKDYRLEHTMRVANLGEQIARAEGLDVEALVIACLLHDVSYCEELSGEEDWLNHGRRAAAIARPFLESLDLEPERIQEICYGIAIHVDDKSDFEGERTPLAISVGDADNLDRFDAYRIYEILQMKAFSKMPIAEKKKTVTTTLERLNNYINMTLGTDFATKLWVERISFFRTFYLKLLDQLKNSEYPAPK
ncbi:HD domain-containing protein [Chloroflexota bacterium]|nr:HD domain-containing protein [Chloroflexota bacterium]